MAISLASLRQASALNPPRILIHGVAGVGKSTFAANAATEDGLGMLKVASFPVAKSFGEMMEGVAALYSAPHEFRTVVVDSVDWLEPLIWKKACEDNRWASVEEPGYGKGYLAALDLWRQYLDGLNALRDERGMTVIQIAHTDIKRFDSPEHEPYDRYVIKLHARAAALLQEHSDIGLFANYRRTSASTRKVNRALGSGERVLYTAERPVFLAKNRYGLPDVLPLGSLRRCDAAALIPDGSPNLRRLHMAHLGATFDATTVDPAAGFELFPAGQYVAQIVSSEMRPTKDGGGQVNASAQTVEIAQRTLSAICHATGRLQVQDSQELHLIPMIADVKVKPPKNGYGKSNKVHYLPLDRGVAAQARAAAPVAGAPPAQPARPAVPSGGFANAPWKR